MFAEYLSKEKRQMRKQLMSIIKEAAPIAEEVINYNSLGLNLTE
jgi:hypothetical protein